MRLTKRLIDGHYADNKNIIARCHVLTHRGFLTKSLIKSHNCVAKKCPFFERLKPEYWHSVEKAEQETKDRRRKRRQELEMLSDRDVIIRETLEDSGHVHVTAIREDGRVIIISYIYDRHVDLMPEIEFLRKKLGRPLKLQARTGSDEAMEQLIRKPRRETRKVTDVRKAPKVGAAAKKRLAALGVYCLEDLFGRDGDALYELDCERSGGAVNRRYLAAYRSAVEFANGLD
ncbi:MAG: helix-hairpin-helix domain-containing protein [Oscillospiraceae bacterium]|jgi:hypothetical protein|nr:helix-hairpin-helix domain-containing protein [Oscillospiraceae bacterium]